MNSQPWWRGHKGEWYVVIQVILFGLIALAPLAPGFPRWGAPWSTITLIVGLGFLAITVVVISGVSLPISPIPMGSTITSFFPLEK